MQSVPLACFPASRVRPNRLRRTQQGGNLSKGDCLLAKSTANRHRGSRWVGEEKPTVLLQTPIRRNKFKKCEQMDEKEQGQEKEKITRLHETSA